MPRAGAYTVSEISDDRPMRIACRRCKRFGQYSKARLLERFGPDATIPDVIRFLANCDRAGSVREPCEAVLAEPVTGSQA